MLNNTELLSDRFFSLPKIYTGNYQKFVKENLEEYLNRIKLFNGEVSKIISNNESNIKHLCNSINLSIDLALNGFHSKSYEVLKGALEPLKEYFLYPKKGGIQLSSSNFSFFKIRHSFKQLNKEDLFHIPFEKRHLVPSNRFSILGCPSIYMSNSLFLAWEELNKPINKHLYAVRFEFINTNLNLLLLDNIPQLVVLINKNQSSQHGEEKNEFYMETSILSWPLMFVTSIPAVNRDFPFKVEYIIPQHLMQWCRESEDLDGIRYFSTRSDFSEINGIPLNQINIALPVRTNSENGFCDYLKKKIRATETIRIRDFKSQQFNEDDKNIWIKNNISSYMNYFNRSVYTGEKRPNIFDRVEIELIKSKAF